MARVLEDRLDYARLWAMEVEGGPLLMPDRGQARGVIGGTSPVHDLEHATVPVEPVVPGI